MRAAAVALAGGLIAGCGGAAARPDGALVDADLRAPDADPRAPDAGPPDAAPITGLTATGASWPAADRLFHLEPRWLGSDAAYSIDLGGDRSLWLFGDTFIATSAANVRTASKFVRNTIAVEAGRDPTTAAMTFAWNTDGTGAPASFFAERGTGMDQRWHWPGGGARLPDGSVIVFLAIEKSTPGVGLGFAGDGWRAVRIVDPTAPPAAWQLDWLDPPAQAFEGVVGSAVATDGGYLLALAAGGGAHPMYLTRFALTDLMADDLSKIEWWSGAAWVAGAALTGAPTAVIGAGGTEGSLHRDPASGRWTWITSEGFGGARVGLASAPTPTGPWSATAAVFTPPESLGPNPFVYAIKAHPELDAGGDLAVTYATNSFTYADLFTADGQANLYWPRFARLTLAPVR
jgi:hypothetical protein